MNTFLHVLSPLPKRKHKRPSVLDISAPINVSTSNSDVQSMISLKTGVQSKQSNTRSIGVQTPVFERKNYLPGDATPNTSRRKRHTKELSPVNKRKTSKEHAVYLASLNLTPVARRKRILPPFPLGDDSSSPPESPSDWDRLDNLQSDTEVLPKVLVVEVGEAGLKYDRKLKVPYLPPTKTSRSKRRRKRGDDQRRSQPKEKRVSFIPDDARGITTIRLHKENNSSYGLIITGGSDKGHRPKVSSLREDYPAAKCDGISVGDYIIGVNGTTTDGLTHESIVDHIRSSGDYLDLEIEYEIPNMPSAGGAVIERTISILLEKTDGTFGFTVRGGQSLNGEPRPFLITQVRPGGPADKEGTLKAGDRLVAIDGRDLTRATLAEAQESLHEVEKKATLTIKYDVSLMDSIRNNGSPLLVEIERIPCTSLGITLAPAKIPPYMTKLTAPLSISGVRTASIAERCGALAIGDYVAAIDGSRLELSDLHNANQMLRNGRSSKITLEIIPFKSFPGHESQSNSSELYESRVNRFSMYHNYSSPFNGTTRRSQRRSDDHSASPGPACGVCRTETIRVTLMNDGRGVGLVLRPGPFMGDLESSFPAIAAIEQGRSADKCGVICIGDILLAVNGRSVGGFSVSEIHQMMANTSPTVILDLEFQVADSVVPSTGTFSVKLSKRNGIGISIARGSSHGNHDVVLISEIIKGSPAHRSGTLEIGDRILAINNTRVDRLQLDEIRNMFVLDGDVVTLRVQKDSDWSEDVGVVVYSVQLVRDGGTLGITASGGEEPFDPIFVAALTPGSIAARTGAVHVGDRILAINNVSLRGKQLSAAVRLLQSPEDNVTLKLSRSKDTPTEDWSDFQGLQALSVDSAVESWDSSALEVPCATSLQDKQDSPSGTYKSYNKGAIKKKNSNKIDSPNNGHTWDSASPVLSVDSGQSDDNTDWEKMISDLNQISETCGLREKSLPNKKLNQISEIPEYDHKYNSGIHKKDEDLIYGKISPYSTHEECTYSVPHATMHKTSSVVPPITPTSPIQVYSMTLLKDPFYEDFGFSLSDGLYEKGVYINRIRKGGPADRTCLLKPYDRILQVNNTRTDDFDCCLTVPLIAAAEDSLFLKVERSYPVAMRPDYRLTTWRESEEDFGCRQMEKLNTLQNHNRTAL